MVLTHPTTDEGKEGEPEQKVQIRPEHSSRNMLTGVQHVMMVVPVDPYVDKAQHITKKHRNERYEVLRRMAMGNLQFQDHDSDDDGDHCVAERFQSALAHAILRCAEG